MSQLLLPKDFVERMNDQVGRDADSFFNSLSQAPPVSIRTNPFKVNENGKLKVENAMRSVPWCDDGFYLIERPEFIYDPFFHAGTYYVQEASSMFVGEVAKRLLKNSTNAIVLDAAAAPGGKSTHLLSSLNHKGFLISNEVIPQRNSILQENIWKWGVSNEAITQQQLSEFGTAGELFDLILLDAPCSGEGLFRRDPSACNEWSLSSVEGCRLRQKQLIADVLPALKVGGYLIYSTCTYAVSENDDNVAQALEKFALEQIDIDVPDGVVQTKHGYQFYPHRVKGEGFYISVLQKTHPTLNHSTRPFQKKKLEQVEISNAFDWNNGEFTTYKFNNTVYAIPTHADELIELIDGFNIKSIGTPLYEDVKGRDVPHPALALHHNYKFHQAVETDETQALQYLYGDALQNESDIKQGYATVNYQSHGLGWVKAASNRWNNLYPHPWRIRRRR